MDGIFINGRRPKSKKEVKEAVAADPASVVVEITTFGQEGRRLLDDCQGPITFVGPDPYTSRKFYGTIKRHPSKGLVVS